MLDVEPASPTGITPLRLCCPHSLPFLWLALHFLLILLYCSRFCHLAAPVSFHRLPLANIPFSLHLCISKPSLSGPGDFLEYWLMVTGLVILKAMGSLLLSCPRILLCQLCLAWPQPQPGLCSLLFWLIS